jgi:O-6-methylguanine DNA methyltransferase
MSIRIVKIGGLTLRLSSSESMLVGIEFADKEEPTKIPELDAVLDETELQLREYFAGERKVFELPIKVDGTPFRRAVWDALTHIPYGETVSYGDIAREINNPKSARAVGGACHVNPIAIVIPCHRVVGTSGKLTGFGGGLDVKKQLLALEEK